VTDRVLSNREKSGNLVQGEKSGNLISQGKCFNQFIPNRRFRDDG